MIQVGVKDQHDELLEGETTDESQLTVPDPPYRDSILIAVGRHLETIGIKNIFCRSNNPPPLSGLRYGNLTINKS